MRTQFKSNQHNVSTDVLRSLFPVGIANTETLTLNSIRASFKGYGHYKIIVDVEVNGMEASFNGVTDNMQTIDSWEEGEEDFNTDLFDSWEDVVDSLLYAVDFEEKVEQLAMSSDEIRPNAREILMENYEEYGRIDKDCSLIEWLEMAMDEDPLLVSWLFYKAENIGDFGSGKTKLQEEVLEEFFECL